MLLCRLFGRLLPVVSLFSPPFIIKKIKKNEARSEVPPNQSISQCLKRFLEETGEGVLWFRLDIKGLLAAKGSESMSSFQIFDDFAL